MPDSKGGMKPRTGRGHLPLPLTVCLSDSCAVPQMLTQQNNTSLEELRAGAEENANFLTQACLTVVSLSPLCWIISSYILPHLLVSPSSHHICYGIMSLVFLLPKWLLPAEQITSSSPSLASLRVLMLRFCQWWFYCLTIQIISLSEWLQRFIWFDFIAGLRKRYTAFVKRICQKTQSVPIQTLFLL